jgi:hypothetical protein
LRGITNGPRRCAVHPFVRLPLPVTAFQRAVDDEGFAALTAECSRAVVFEKEIRVAALSFIELVDLRCATDRAVDFRLCCSILEKIGTDDDEQLIRDLMHLFGVGSLFLRRFSTFLETPKSPKNLRRALR